LFAQNTNTTDPPNSSSPVDNNTNTSNTTDVNSTTPTNTEPGMNTSTDNTTTSLSTGNYNAYGTTVVNVPSTVQYSFQRDYPDVTNAQWYQTPNGQLRVMYKDNNNQDMDVYYYGNSAQSYMVSLPVRQSLTPEDVISKAKSMFGMSVYDINRVKAANNDYVYHVRLLDNGQVRSVWISEQGTEVAATDVFRTSDMTNNDIIDEVNTATNGSTTNERTTNSNNNTNTSTNTDANNANTNTTTTADDSTTTSDASDTNPNTDSKMKIKSSDGTKIKIEDDKIKVK
jgi:hypothetical protein